MLSEEKEVLGYIREAFSLKEQKLYKPAVEMLYKALSMDEDNIEVLYQLGELYSLMHNYTRATDYLQQVLAQTPNHMETLKLSEQICEKQEDYIMALDFAKRIFEKQNNNDNFKNIIKLLGKLKQTEELETYINSEFCNAETAYEIANALYINGKSEPAKELLEKYCSNENASVLLGKIYFDNGELKKSKEIFAKFPKTCDNPEILNYRGLFALEDMEFTEAIKCFSKASSISKSNPTYFYNLANAYFFNGWMEEAQKSYSKAIYLAPDNMDYRYSLAYLYYEINALDKCKKEVEAILSSCHQHSGALVLKALLLNSENKFMQAKDILEQNIANGCNDDFTLVSLGKTYSFLDMFEKAEKVLLEIIERNPENLDYISDLSDIYIRKKMFDKAFELAEKTMQINPNYVYGYILGAKTAYLKEDYNNAKVYAQRALSLDMNCSDGYYYLAMVRYTEEDYEEAIECMKRAITYDAMNPLYYAEMSKIYRSKNDIKTALEYISEAESISHSTEYKMMYRELARLNKSK